MEDSGTPVVGKLDFTIQSGRPKVISLPADKEYQSEAAARSRKRKSGSGDEFLTSKAGTALARLKVINE